MYSHHEVVGNVSEKCRKTDEISLEAHFCENKTKNITTKNLKNFWKIFRDFSVSYRQTSGKSYTNKHSTILVQYLSQVYLSKHTKVQWFSQRKPKVFVLQILRQYLTKEGRVRKLFYCLIRIKEPCVRKYEGLTRSKILGILQTGLLNLRSIRLLGGPYGLRGTSD